MNAVVSGATGLIGRLLVEQLDQVTILTRAEQSNQNADETRSTVTWKPSDEPAPIEALEHRDVIFHLAGEPVAAGRWSNDKKQRIRDSRVTGTRHLVEGIAACEHPPKILIAASAVGFYGDRGDEVLDERSEQGSGFLPEVCSDWEHEAMKAERYGVRVVCLRIGIVLADDGGALEQMVPIFRLGAGGKLGSGQQWMSWIHVDDVVGLLLWAARIHRSKGVNAVAPIRFAILSSQTPCSSAPAACVHAGARIGCGCCSVRRPRSSWRHNKCIQSRLNATVSPSSSPS